MTDSERLQTLLEPLSAGRATVRVRDGRANIVLDVRGMPEAVRTAMEQDLRAAAEAEPGIREARVLMTSARTERRLIAVASGKGGVGKSTVSANLAIALARAGARVGLVDADIYGPSQPKLMGVEGTRAEARDKKLVPVETRFGVPLLSMGGLVPDGQAIAWRGAMAGNALGQLIDAHWDDRDLLLLDLPPGTGDLQLTMVQKHKPAGAVIVSTPQDLALIDATRAIDLFTKVGVPVIGIVENMAVYHCPECGAPSHPFGTGGAEEAATRLGVPFLGRLPLEIAIRTGSDSGDPPAAGNGPVAAAFGELAGRVSDWLARPGE